MVTFLSCFFAQMETILFAGSRNGKRPAKFYRTSGKLRRQGQIANTGQLCKENEEPGPFSHAENQISILSYVKHVPFVTGCPPVLVRKRFKEEFVYLEIELFL
ncbi:hypothetical protein B4096_2029 [Heyndrickxia coagulans]|jgi:hypothetical protein|nr:hypothetical protein B4096_2029 [Heyndrickxia coagulans]